MANPPIVIGPFDNVPAPGSPIRSNWPQEISQWVIDNAAAVDARFQSIRAQPYVNRRGSDDVTPVGVFGTVASITLGAAYAGQWLLAGTALVASASNDIAIVRLRGGGVDVGPWVSNWDITAGKRTPLSLIEVLTIPTTAANYTFSIDAYGYGSQLQLLTGSRLVAVFLGP